MNKVDNCLLKAFCNSPLHIAKRDTLIWWKAWGVRAISVVLALLVVVALVLVLSFSSVRFVLAVLP